MGGGGAGAPARRARDTLIDVFVEELRGRNRKHVVADVSSANESSRALFRRAGWDEGISVTFFTRRLD